MFELKTLRFAYDRRKYQWRADTPRQKTLGISATGKLSIHEICNIPHWMTREQVAQKLPRNRSDWTSYLDFTLRHQW